MDQDSAPLFTLTMKQRVVISVITGAVALALFNPETFKFTSMVTEKLGIGEISRVSGKPHWSGMVIHAAVFAAVAFAGMSIYNFRSDV